MPQATIELKGWVSSKEKRELLNCVLAQVLAGGPTRICVDPETAYSVPPDQARKSYGVKRPYLVFIREDGWTLGCTEETQSAAFKLWREDWVAVIDTECTFDFAPVVPGPLGLPEFGPTWDQDDDELRL